MEKLVEGQRSGQGVENDRSRGIEPGLRRRQAQGEGQWYRVGVEGHSVRPKFPFQLLSAEDAHLGSVGVVFGRAEGREDKRLKASHFSARLYCRVRPSSPQQFEVLTLFSQTRLPPAVCWWKGLPESRTSP